MRGAVRDAGLLRLLRPLDVAAYLRTTGWDSRTQEPARYCRFVRPEAEEGVFEIELPLDAELADYALRMRELLATLEIVEHRPQLRILEDLLTPSCDLVRIRVHGPASADGTLPMEDAVRLLTHARDLMLAAACAAVQPLSLYDPRKVPMAWEYLRRVRLGQSERGSYVITLVSPVPPGLAGYGPEQQEKLSEPYERRVTLMLQGSLRALLDATGQAAISGDLKPFRDAVSRGVSANLCFAVAGMAGPGRDRSLGITITWARTREGGAHSRLSFSPDTIPIIVEAGRVLSEIGTRPDYDLQGVVVQVAEGQPLAVLAAIIEDKLRRVLVELSQDDLRRAQQAREDGTLVRVTGLLCKDRRNYVLRQARDLVALKED